MASEVLSELPDSILTHILSFLLTRDSVRTCVLGQRWRYLWTHVPILDFTCVSLDFIRRFMRLHNKLQDIDSFRLDLRDDYESFYESYDEMLDDPLLHAWITSAIDRNVRNLHLAAFDTRIFPSRCFFTCKTLVHLTLDSCEVVGGAVCLPRLKKLHLFYPYFGSDASLPKIISGCPVIDELILDEPSTVMSSCIISSPTIKRVTLNFEGTGNRFNVLKMNTPALDYLEIADRLPVHFEFGQLTSLIEANINIFEDVVQEDYFLYSRSLLGFIDLFCNVKCLKLDLLFRKVVCFHSTFNLPSPHCPLLNRFSLLGLQSFFLERADNLETLIFSKYGCEEIEWWIKHPPQQVPKCLLSRLKIIKIASVKGETHEFEIIRYLIWNAKVLETMEIGLGSCIGFEKRFTMHHGITRLPRGSTLCEVAFVGAVKGLHNALIIR
ncbi:hypothetical protein MIMGU_mgv1a026190mg [Erythranthe guttata]|uniref:FBD domain-containing protein n=1 Tax=Erythranthe guttata TaxID=4155 RepID=A0A022RMZ2_ERYGU|nr:hypothetical protein MIMGU_mgv1a026190mg [Erythranthe guttata]